MNPVAGNRILAALPGADRKRIVAACDDVELRFGQELARPRVAMRHVYFPQTSFISQFSRQGEDALEVGLVGPEGMCGVTALLGPRWSPHRLVVQGEGSCLRMAMAPFMLLLATSPALDESLRRYVFALMVQLGQAALCTRYHAVEPRLARWLLMMDDRAPGAPQRLTHAFLSEMLGVRREGITQAASALQRRGLIHYGRARIAVGDRDGLEAAACPCYAADLDTYRRVMQPLARARTRQGADHGH